MTKDVELVIRARDEGTKAIKSFVSTIEDLVGAQGDLATSSRKTNSVLTNLGSEFAALNQQVQGLSAFGKVVSTLDKAAASVTRLEASVSKATAEQERLTAAQNAAATATAKAKSAADGAAAAYDKQASQAKAVRDEAGKTSAAYKEQAEGLTLANLVRKDANKNLRDAQREEKAVGVNLGLVSQQLSDQGAALQGAQAEWEGLYSAASSAGALLGGVAASQDDVAQAAARAAEKLALSKGAMDFAKEAAGAKRLREAADYVRFWTKALTEKDAAEAGERSSRSAEMFAQVNREAKDAADFMEQYQAKLNASLGVQEKFANSARESFAVFADAGRAEDQMSAAAARLRAQVDPLAAVQAAHNAELTRARDLYRAGYISANELAKAETHLAASTDLATKAIARSSGSQGGGGGTLFGLRPYELHSLSYQVNDVITQIASGTPLMQVLAQQGGQVFQVFQRQLVPSLAKAGPLIAALGPAILTVGASAAVLVNVAKNVNDMTASFREFSGELTINADGAIYNAHALAQTAHELDVYGGKIEDTRKALSEFTKAGINPAILEDFGRAAQDMADVTGSELPAAAERMGDAFSAGFEQIAKLDNELNFLTAAERDQIKAMFESGKASEGRTRAFDLFSNKMNDGARNMRGPWSEAIKNMASAWDNFLGFVEDSAPIQAAIKLLGGLAEAAKDATALLPGAEERAAEATTGAGGVETLRVERELTALRQARADAAEREARVTANGGKRLLTGDKQNNLRAPGSTPASEGSLAQIDAKIIAKEQELIAVRKAAADTIAAESEAKLKAQAAAISGIEREREALGDLTDQQKINQAAEKAYREEILASGDLVIAQKKKQLAIDKEIDRQRQSVNFGGLAGKIAGIESSGDANAKNPNSTATGLGQFIEDTWIKLFKKHFPAEAAGKSEQAILDLRKNADLSKKMIEIYARENAAVLQKAGVAVNEASVYLAHFLGPKGAEKVLKAASNTPTSQILSGEAINANKSVLKGKTAGDVVGWAQGKVGSSDGERGALAAQAEAAEALRKAAEERKKAQDGFNDAVDDENRKRTRGAEVASATNGLMGEALILEQRKIAIQDAVRDAQEKAAEASEDEIRAGRTKIEVTAAQRAEIEKTAAAEFDASHQSLILAARVQESDTNMNALLERRQLLLEQIGFAQQQGDGAGAESLLAEYEGVNLQIENATTSAVAFWQALAGDPAQLAMLGMTAAQVQNIVIALQNGVVATKNFNTQILATGAQINQMIAQGAVGAFDQFAQSVAEGKNVFESAGDAFRTFAADFLKQIAAMIIQQAILNALGGGAGGGGAGGGIAGLIGKLFHEGGVVGRGGGKTRSVSPTWFANAPRYHTGGIAGFKPGEVPAILKKNEEVLTEDDPRHVLNGGAAGAGPEVNVKVINALDAGDMVSQGLNTRAGERAVLNVIKANSGAVSASLGARG